MTLDMQFKIAKNLKALRKAKKLSQQALAEKMSICRSGYCQYEQGDRLPDLAILFELSQFYHIKIDTLINCDVQMVLSDYFLHEEYTLDEQALIQLYENLSDFSKGRLIERAEELTQFDQAKRDQSLQIRY